MRPLIRSELGRNQEIEHESKDGEYHKEEVFQGRLPHIETHEGDEEDQDQQDQYILESDLLIIDDLGTEFTTALSLAEFFSLINERHLRKKSTIISTNLSLDDLQDRYKDRIFSRLFTNYNLIKLTGPDIRILKKRKLIRK